MTLSTQVASNKVTVSGTNSAAAVSVTGGEYNINGGSFTSTAGTVGNGDKVSVRHTSSDSFGKSTITVLTIGGVTGTFTTTTDRDSDGDGSGDSVDTDPNDAGVAGVVSSDGSTITISASGMLLGDVQTISKDSVSTVNKPTDSQIVGDILSYNIMGIGGNGATASVTLIYPSNLSADTKIYKIDDAGFTEFTNAVISGNKVTLTLTDGGTGDADKLANGTISDPVVAMEPTSTRSGGGGGSADLLLLLMLLGSVLVYTRRFRFKVN